MLKNQLLDAYKGADSAEIIVDAEYHQVSPFH